MFDARFPNRKPPFTEYTLLEVTPDGSIVGEWSVAELLQENNLAGLLYLGTLDNKSTEVRGDPLHLNVVEPFPYTMEEDFFGHGDILVSLRNINTVFVFKRDSRKIKFIATGWFVRQHDPDFIDGNTFSVFYNNNIAPEEYGQQSRIVIVSARERTLEVFFEGSLESPFYTNIMGKHQWLPIGNVLITEFKQGRAFEINRAGQVVWEYINEFRNTQIVGDVTEMQRLPAEYRQVFGNNQSRGNQPNPQGVGSVENTTAGGEAMKPRLWGALYIGPGTGLSAVGVFLAVVAAVIVVLFGFVWYPVKRLLRNKRKQKPRDGAQGRGRE